MASKKHEPFFWTSYADLMTSLFFLMLVVSVVSIVALERKKREIEREHKRLQEEYAVTKRQIEQIQQIEKAAQAIDSRYFDYNDEYKKHVLRVHVKFPKGSAEMATIPKSVRERLRKAGLAMQQFVREECEKYKEQSGGNPGAGRLKFLMVIEGQASRDGYAYNNELSYARALALYKFFKRENLLPPSDDCEVLIAGSGIGGEMRSLHEDENQRFLINILPKPGVAGRVEEAEETEKNVVERDSTTRYEH